MHAIMMCNVSHNQTITYKFWVVVVRGVSSTTWDNCRDEMVKIYILENINIELEINDTLRNRILQNGNTVCIGSSNLEWVITATSRISNLETEIIDSPKIRNALRRFMELSRELVTYHLLRIVTIFKRYKQYIECSKTLLKGYKQSYNTK